MNLISLDDYDRERIAHRRLGCQETWKKEGREGGKGCNELGYYKLRQIRVMSLIAKVEKFRVTLNRKFFLHFL